MKLTIVAVIALVAVCSGFKETTNWGNTTLSAYMHEVEVHKLANPYNFHNFHLDFPKSGETNNRTILGIKQVDYAHPPSKVDIVEGGLGFKNVTLTIFAACGVEVNSTFTFYLA